MERLDVTQTTRRGLLRLGTQSTLATAVFAGMTDGPAHAALLQGDKKLWPGFPRQDLTRVAEVVGAAHFDEKRVKELVKAYPELVNACWDWGFGDWETPLGAAAHTGQRELALFLLAQGARIDLFAAAMLGFTEVVKAFVVAQPGIQRSLGPHGITLLAHAKAGEKLAAETVAYLETLGDADGGIKAAPLSAEDRRRYLGNYASDRLDLKLVCRLNKAERLVVDVQTRDNLSDGRLIHYLGNDEFFPAGVPSVRLRFTRERDKATSVTIRGSVPEVALQRGAGGPISE